VSIVISLRRGAAVTTAMCLLLALPATANADLVLVAKDQRDTGYSLVGNDTSNEDNRITVALDHAASRWVISDEAGVVDGVGECVALSATVASCLAAPFNNVKLETEGGRDVVRAIGEYAALGPLSARYVDLTVELGSGRDRFFGGGGANGVSGGAGRDRLVGGDEYDGLFGGRGADRLVGRGGRDHLQGGAGGDFLSTNSGRKGLMLGGRGKDRCVAGRGSHRVGACERVTVR
jgi:Ca2+-binding RTX toxin-like protein